MRKKSGFTLAEVLITIGIIGIVAQATIPTLVSNFQKQICLTQLKKVYTVMNSAVKLSTIDNGPISDWNMTGDTENDYKIFAEQYILPYLMVSKRCQSLTNECWADNCYFLDNSYNYYFAAAANTTYSIMLNDGAVLGFWPRGSLTEIYIDINGRKKPNIEGKDLFIIVIAKNARDDVFGTINNPGVYFYGQGRSRTDLMTTGYPCAKSGSLPGTYCGALIMYDDWQLKDDYPW